MKRAAVLAVAAVLSLPAGVASAQEPEPRPPNAPNVVVVMTDDQRDDDMARSRGRAA